MDDLLDLNFSSSSTPQANQRKGKSAFDYLAASSGVYTSTLAPVQAPVRATTPIRATTPVSSKPATSSDAFDSLFGEKALPAKMDALPMSARLSGRSSPMQYQQKPQLTSSDPWDFDLLSSSSTPGPSASTSAIPSPALASTPATKDDFELAFDKPSQQDDFDLAFSPKPTAKQDDFELALDSPPRSAVSPNQAEDLDAETIKRQAAELLHTYQRKKPARSTSPPPHILGQLVELGFSIPEAKKALSETYTDKWNVEAAADSLLGQGQRQEVLPPRPGRRTPDSRSENKAEGKEADYLAQASVLGNSLFKQANAYWKTGKKVVSKAIEEQRSASAAPRDGRPKWMQDVPLDEPQQASTSSFRDDDAPTRPQASSTPTSRTQTPVSAPPKPQPAERKVYQSSARRAVPQRTADSPKPTPTPSPKPTFTRPSIPCSAAALQQSNAHREKGNEHFKLGAYSEAESCYSTALACLPEGHLSRISVLNNRANAKLKNGNERSAVVDASDVIALILCGRPVAEVESEMRADLGKAFVRRARGLEACEKWSEACKDYEVILGAGESMIKPAGGIGVVGAGLSRCKKALLPTVRPPRKPTPKVQVQPSGDAVKELRKTAVLAEKDEATKDALKDSVDERVLAWKGGKEANIRALVASLETVLWPELGWKKVGMHELISEGQLKVRYMRAIGKLHPDKLNVHNTTVEQRMIANAVFSALNDAWNAART